MNTFFKRAVLMLTVVSLLLTVSCSLARVSTDTSDIRVTLVYGDGRENSTAYYKSGDFLEPQIPVRDGYEFVGWCTNKDLTNFYDYSRPVGANMILYAKWELDYKDLLVKASEDAVSASVKVQVSLPFGMMNQGSGVVYKSFGNVCYVLTNNHVIGTGYNSGIAVIDAYGTKYPAALVKSDPSFDLAVLKINVSGSHKFKIADLEARIPKENETAVMVSAPNGQFNTVTLGEVVWYHELDQDTSSMANSDVNFKVLWIDGKADHGSSGGAVFDTDMNVIGIIYAIVTLSEGDEKRVLAIPAENVLEFISDIEY